MNAPVRRLLAFALDYLVIAAYVVTLAAASLVVLATPGRAAYEAVWANAWSAELADQGDDLACGVVDRGPRIMPSCSTRPPPTELHDHTLRVVLGIILGSA